MSPRWDDEASDRSHQLRRGARQRHDRIRKHGRRSRDWVGLV